MDWDQIENKWSAMTRRVRADWPANGDAADGAAAVLPVSRRPKIADPGAALVAGQQTALAAEARVKTFVT